ncbi:hypothetical protein P280DRAFT_370567, partial [Massarina eburnea CBS 473.64]
ALKVPGQHQGRIVTERVAYRQLTREFAEPNKSEEKEKGKYRQHLLDILRGRDAHSPSQELPSAAETIQKFLLLAATMDSTKAAAFTDVTVANTLIETHAKTLRSTATPSSQKAAFLCQNTSLLHHEANDEPCIHPLFILLLAYRIGGPINAANTAYAHQWKAPNSANPESAADLVHTEGDTGDFMEDHRLTFAWEMRDGVAKTPSGIHDIFPSGTKEVKDLSYIRDREKDGKGPVAILYDVKNAACCYTCQDADAVRCSVTFDFRINRMGDVEASLFAPALTRGELEELTLSRLLLSFPIHDYTSHFHRLLFRPSSLCAILSKLSDLDIPPIPPPSDTIPIPSAKERYDAWESENRESNPRPTRKYPETLLTGLYPRVETFIENLVTTAHQTIHLSPGLDFLPRSGSLGIREDARKWFRDLNETSISHILTPYTRILTHYPFNTSDMLSTPTLSQIAHRLSIIALALTCSPHLPTSTRPASYSLLPSLASLTSTLSTVFASPLESAFVPEPWIDDVDLGIFGSRCLFLFYCADWLAKWVWGVENASMKVGAFVGLEVEGKVVGVGVVRLWVREWTGLLVRNWVAWGLFVEGFPGVPFRVRRFGGEVGGR